MSAVDVAIIGAGPYGLSIAAHLSALGLDFRIFGVPMQAWRDHMPVGMHLKSDGSSSDISDPEDSLTLKAFCAQAGWEHHDTEKPVSLACFVAYGLAFQKRFAPQVEPKLLVSLEKLPTGFRLSFDDGEVVQARRVVLAVGVGPFKHIPDLLGELPPELMSHSSEYGNTDRHSRKQVAVLGAGASALDLAALLREGGADVLVVSRRPSVEFHGPPGHRALWRRMARPTSGIGNGWRLRIFSAVPQIFHMLPKRVRHHQVGTLLGPAAGWFMKERVVGQVTLLTGCTPLSAAVRGGRVRLDVVAGDGKRQDVVVDHLVAATGYKIELARLRFLTRELRGAIRTDGTGPALSSNFESSVTGLFFVGPAAMNSFGPVVRFVYGARYTAGRISRHLLRTEIDVPSAARMRPEGYGARDLAVGPDPASP